MPREPRWLIRVLIATVCTITLLSVSWSASCTGAGFLGLSYASSKECEDHDNRALQTLFSLLATLVSLRSNPPTNGD
jgi:hypothetical protein